MAVTELDPVLVVFLRAGVAALVLLPVALEKGALAPILPRWRAVVLLTAIEIVGPRWPASR